jgi:hypothetical protein
MDISAIAAEQISGDLTPPEALASAGAFSLCRRPSTSADDLRTPFAKIIIALAPL